MNNNMTDITIVLDRSGSMESTRQDTIGGFNRFLDDQKKVPGQATLTLHQFDHEHETPVKCQDIQRVAPLTMATYAPRGSTALLDAIGRAVNETGNRLDGIPEQFRPGKVVFVIITDGEENASHEFTRPQVFERIKHQREKYAWEFVFLGANQDAITSGASIGVLRSASMNFVPTGKSVATYYSAVAENLRGFRTSNKADMTFTASQVTAQDQVNAETTSENKSTD